MDIIGIRTPGLGNTTYLAHHDGVGVLVDPQRDVDRFLAAADDADVEIRFVVETHIHNDYLSGGREAARLTGAELVIPAGAGVGFPHTAAFHNEDVSYRGLTLRPIHTPGHTPEHVTYLALVVREPVGLFSGGSLLAGAVGRTDLLGDERARQLARLQFRTIQRLGGLPDQVGLYPTHGAGSFCAATPSGRTVSSIGEEKRANPVFHYSDEDEFVEAQLAGLQPYPRYYAQMGGLNLLGGPPLPDLAVPALTPAQVTARRDDVQVVDARPRGRFAASHLPGSVGIELDNDFATWVGWLLPFDSPLILVLDPRQDAHQAVLRLARIGFDHVEGVLWGVDEWNREGLPLVSHHTSTSHDLATADGAQILDVRSPGEWEEGHLAGSVHCYLPDLVEAAPPGLEASKPVWVVCASGRRASVAAGLLERHRYQPVVVAQGGVVSILNGGQR